MEKGYINVTKVKYIFKDGNEMQGLEISLAPKVKKFIQMNKDNADLLRVMGNGLVDWYYRAEFGDDIVLSAYTGKDKVVDPNVVDVHFN